MTHTNVDLKMTALKLRQQGISMIVIERQLGVARSTLSGWFKSIPLSESQRQILETSKLKGLEKARSASIESKRIQKINRLKTAENEALATLSNININDPSVLELSLAMLYWGEGAKSNTMSLGNSDPNILRFFIHAVHQCYKIPKENIRCDLHLRMDQDENAMKSYWSDQLRLPISSIRFVSFDKRTAKKPTHSYYKGVCQIYYGSIALQRRLLFVYTHYCNKITAPGEGA